MNKFTTIVLLLIVSAVTVVSSGHALDVDDASITSAIVERAPVDSLNSISADSIRLYCYTKVSGAVDDTWITHVWYWHDREMARVRLPVQSSNWRTWSSKQMLPQWSGQWRVEVLDADEHHLLVIPFSIE